MNPVPDQAQADHAALCDTGYFKECKRWPETAYYAAMGIIGLLLSWYLSHVMASPATYSVTAYAAHRLRIVVWVGAAVSVCCVVIVLVRAIRWIQTLNRCHARGLTRDRRRAAMAFHRHCDEPHQVLPEVDEEHNLGRPLSGTARNITLSDDAWAKLGDLADIEQVSRSELVSRAVAGYLASR